MCTRLSACSIRDLWLVTGEPKSPQQAVANVTVVGPQRTFAGGKGPPWHADRPPGSGQRQGSRDADDVLRRRCGTAVSCQPAGRGESEDPAGLRSEERRVGKGRGRWRESR